MKGSSGNEGSDKKVPTNDITSAKEMIGQHQLNKDSYWIVLKNCTSLRSCTYPINCELSAAFQQFQWNVYVGGHQMWLFPITESFHAPFQTSQVTPSSPMTSLSSSFSFYQQKCIKRMSPYVLFRFSFEDKVCGPGDKFCSQCLGDRGGPHSLFYWQSLYRLYLLHSYCVDQIQSLV